MSDGDADANTSTGAPDTIWVARAPDDPKLKLMDVAGWRTRKPAASSVNVAVSEDAADTVTEPDRRALVVDVVVADVDEVEHAAVTTTMTARATTALVRRYGLFMTG
jgi:hypothetical protein